MTLAILALLLSACTHPAPPAKVAIVGIDGASWSNLDPLIERGLLPNFARLRDEGATANLIVDSAQSPESWTSLATGVHPERHGIHQTPGVEGSTFFAGPDQLKVKRVWDIAGEAGKRSLVANYWITPRAYPVRGVMICRESAELYPADFGKGSYADLEPDQYRDQLHRLGLTAAKSGLIATALEREDFDLYLLPIYSFDQALHMLWDEWEAGELLARQGKGLEGLSEAELSAIDVGHGIVVETAKLADRLLGQAYKEIGPDGYVMVVSDHGHTAADPSMRRIALSRSILDGSRGTAENGSFHVGSATVKIDHVDQRIMRAVPQFGYLLRYPVLRVTDDPDGSVRAGLLAQTLSTGEPLLAVQGETLVPSKAVFSLAHTALGRLDEPQFSIFVNSGSHSTKELGIFGLIGPDVAPGRMSAEVRSVDAAPTALWLMGVAYGEDMDGRPATAALTEAGQKTRKPQSVTTWEDGTRPWADPRTQQLSAEEIERLKALGYLSQ